MRDKELEIRIGDVVELDLWHTLEQGIVISYIGDKLTIHQSNRDVRIDLNVKFITRIVLRREDVKDFWIYLGREK